MGKKTQFSKEILNEIKSLKNKELSKPLRTPAGYLIIMYDKKKVLKNSLIKKELDYLKKFENNRQLNQFSLIYFKDLKKIQLFMNINKILIILGEPNSIFSEILAKFLVSNKFRIIKKNYINWKY